MRICSGIGRKEDAEAHDELRTLEVHIQTLLLEVRNEKTKYFSIVLDRTGG